jgi:hypothetical protein
VDVLNAHELRAGRGRMTRLRRNGAPLAAIAALLGFASWAASCAVAIDLAA